jgi:hypothetical protein
MPTNTPVVMVDAMFRRPQTCHSLWLFLPVSPASVPNPVTPANCVTGGGTSSTGGPFVSRTLRYPAPLRTSRYFHVAAFAACSSPCSRSTPACRAALKQLYRATSLPRSTTITTRQTPLREPVVAAVWFWGRDKAHPEADTEAPSRTSCRYQGANPWSSSFFDSASRS